MKRILLFVVLLSLLLPMACRPKQDKQIVVGISWSSSQGKSFKGTYLALQAIGVKPVALGQVISTDVEYENNEVKEHQLDENGILLEPQAALVKQYTYQHSNIEQIMKGIDAVVFTGGEDISPTLFREMQPWHGIEPEKNYNTTRDISDYILLSYCIDNDIPTLCICRGEQMLGVVSGAGFIQDVETFYREQGADYNYSHRCNKQDTTLRHDYVRHDVELAAKASLLRDIVGADVEHNVPSWHHQAVGSLEGTNLRKSATTTIDGVEIVEAIERTDKRFVLGVQYHPEVALYKMEHDEENASDYMSRERVLRYFEALRDAVKK